MPWVRYDDDMLDHAKWRRALRLAGDGVLATWHRLTAWCSRRLTDGVVPSDMVDEVAELAGSKTRAKCLKALIDAQLLAWCAPGEDSIDLRLGRAEPTPRARRADDDLVVVGYLKRNPSADKVHADRERRAKAQQDYIDRKKLTNQHPTSAVASAPGRAAAVMPDADDVPSRPVPSQLIQDIESGSETSARAGDASRAYDLPRPEPDAAYLDEAKLAGVHPEQARSTWKHYWGAGLPAEGVPRLNAWLVQRAVERQVSQTKLETKRQSRDVAPGFESPPRNGPPQGWQPDSAIRAITDRGGLPFEGLAREYRQQKFEKPLTGTEADRGFAAYCRERVAQTRKAANG